MVLENMVQEHMVLDYKSRLKSPKSAMNQCSINCMVLFVASIEVRQIQSGKPGNTAL